MLRLDCEVMLLSLNDKFILTTWGSSERNVDFNLSIKRISSKYKRKTRFSLAQKYIDEFRPEWISLQYVPYSFHKKGMDIFLPHFFLKLKKGYKWHLMVHEPWVSNEVFFTRDTIIGLIQKHLFRNLVTKLRPFLIHTSNPYYREILKSGGVHSELLHLPGNIPVIYEKTCLMQKEFNELGILEDSRNQWLVLGTFGRIRANVLYTALLEKVLKTPETANKKIAFLSIGSTGPFAEIFFAEIKKKFRDRVLIHDFGYREVAEISAFFQCLDFGIASVPYHLIGKSGAYAAMRHHGLKVLIPESNEIKEQVLKEIYNSEYLLGAKDADFSSEKVAKSLLLALKSNPNEKVGQEGIHENSIHQS